MRPATSQVPESRSPVGAQFSDRLDGHPRSGSFWAVLSRARNGSPFPASRSWTVRIVHLSGRRSGSSSSSHVIGTDTGAPGAGRGEYGATSVLLIAFWV